MTILARKNIATANEDTLIYTVKDGEVATVLINICNRQDTQNKISLALTKGDLPTDSDWLEYKAPLDPHSPLERTPQPLAAGETIYVSVSQAGVSVVVTAEVDKI